MSRLNLISSKRLAGAAMKMAAALTAVLLCGCERRMLYDPEYGTKLRVEIDVENIRNVTCDVYNPNIPLPEIETEMMHVMLYDEEGRHVVTELYVSDKEVNGEGRTVFKSIMNVLPGKYRLLSYNFGTEAAVVEDWHEADKAYVHSSPVPEKLSMMYRKHSSKAPDDEMEAVVYEPEHLMVASDYVDIPYHSEVYTIEADATTVVETWYIQIRVDGLKYVNSAQAFLSGMVSANYIASDRRVTDPQVTVWFPMVKSTDNDKDVICAVFNTFGRVDGSVNDLRITFGINTVDGKTTMKEFDISDLFGTENAKLHHWLLLDETIEVEEPEIEGGGGFDPSVGDWEEEEKEIII